MVSKVAIVKMSGDTEASFREALRLIGGISDLDNKDRQVVIKVGVYDHKKKNHPSVDVVGAIIHSFGSAPHIFVAESDNYRGTGSERLGIWKQLFTDRVVPFNLSEDSDTKPLKTSNEEIGLSHILFKPNVLVSAHVLRRYERGAVLKNLFGLVPDGKKARFHKVLDSLLMDIYEATGGVDLAVIDGTQAYASATDPKGKRTNILLVGRDAVAVEAVGASIVGMSPTKIPVIREAMRRNLGEGDLSRIDVLGESIENVKKKLRESSGGKPKK
jgi:uncharacterized protein (DUF362 family)